MLTDEDVDKILCEISAEEDISGCCRYRNVISDREALQWAAQAIVETLRQIRDRLLKPSAPSKKCPTCGKIC